MIQQALDPICFMINSFAMGDVIASAPAVKFMVDTYFPDHKNYKVCVKPMFRQFFPFVPDENILDFDKKDNLWGIPPEYAIAALNRKTESRLPRQTPKHISLGQYAGLQFADRIIDNKYLNYISIKQVDISAFDIDFSKAVILITSYRDVTRMWKNDSILEFSTYLKSRGFIPVFVGKSDMDSALGENVKTKISLPNDIGGYGVDLRNKTSIAELATIMSKSRAVCGVDSGPIHLAGTTSTPIICGYTSVSAEVRIPVRQHGITIPIEPELKCIGCESKWHSTYWNFENCFYKTAECVNMLTSDKFIEAFQKIYS
jgi:hypothetical protein